MGFFVGFFLCGFIFFWGGGGVSLLSGFLWQPLKTDVTYDILWYRYLTLQ